MQSISPVRKRYPYSKPSVSTNTSTNLTSTTITFNGNVTSQGSTTVSARGFVYSKNSNPFLSNATTTSNGTGTGAFSANVTGLDSNTTYYVKAYATNSIGTKYGSQKTILTNSAGIPIVTTTTATEIFSTTAISGGNVTSIGGSAVTEKGICYGLSPNPTTASTKIAGGSGIGSFTSNLTDLTPYTNYYIRAYAINSQGTSYGNQVTLQTLQVPQTPFFTYIDDMETILPSPSLTTELRAFEIEKQITIPIYYMGSLLSVSGNRTLMRALLSTNVTQGITTNGVNVTQASNAVDTENPASKASFNNGAANNSEKFTHFFEEIEFWKSNPYVTSFAEYQTQCDEIKEWTDSNGVTFCVYFARCRDCATVSPQNPEDIATYLVDTFDTLMLVDYVDTDKFNRYNGLSPSIRAEIELIATAAKNAGVVKKLNVIFAANGNLVDDVPTNMRSYFVANPTLLPAYNQMLSEYNNWDFDDKEFLDFQGMTIYSYSGISDL